MDTALVNVTLLTLDSERRIIPDGCLIVRDDRIEAVGDRAELIRRIAQSQRTIDGRGMVAVPGFVNAHTHSFQSLLRGLADGMDLIGFLRNVVYPVSPVITPEETRLGAAISVLEAIKSGTTCLIDNHSADTGFEATDAIAQIFAESGLRGLVARGFRQPTARARAWRVPEHAFQFSLAEEIEITRGLIEKWRREADGRVQVCPAPLTLFLAGPDDLRAAKALADEYAVPVHVHVAEARSEVEATLEDYGCREVEHLARVGVLDRRFHVVHGIWLDERELDLLAERGGHVVHCPTSNMSLASGVARVPEMLARGVNVALASDGLGNHNHDMFSVMKTASLLHRVHTLRPDALRPQQVLEMATLGGARALGLEKEIGSLEPGKRADLVLLDLRKPHLVPVYDLPTAIVHGANAADVDTVMVDGQVIMESRRVKTLDEAAIVSAVEAAGPELLRRAGLSS
ncbi:MAG: amidohydrolase [Chloroflexi bacterium]|nr:amidohydrolase [Chloroflexota bacterium]